MAQNDPSDKKDETTRLMAQPLPALPRESVERIARAKKEATEQYDQDKIPYFPMNPDFSFLEGSVLRSIRSIIEYLRIFTERIMDADLGEYLDYQPRELLTNKALLESIANDALMRTEELWRGYHITLDSEPSFRHAEFMAAMASGSMNNYVERYSSAYPSEEKWARWVHRMSEPGSEIAQLDERFKATMVRTITERIRHFQNEAASRLKLKPPIEPRPDHCCLPNKYELAGRPASQSTEDLTRQAPPATTSPQAAQSGSQTAPVRAKTGPKPDLETAGRVKDIVKRVAGQEPWKPKLDEICEDLDEAGIPCPRPWQRREVRSWSDAAATEPQLAMKAIEYRLNQGRK